MTRTDEDQGVRSALIAIAITGGLLTVASPFVLGKSAVFSVALGAAIAAFNLWSLARIVRAFMNGAGLPWVLLGAMKLFGLLAVVALVLHLGIASVLPLAVGFVALPIGIVFAQIGAAQRPATAPRIPGGIEADSGPQSPDSRLKG